MTTLNGLPRAWDSFIQGICAINKLVKFSRLWEELLQKESRILAWEENMGSEYQALTVKSKKTRKSHHRGKHSHWKSNFRKSKYMSKFIFYTCDERWHFARDCSRNKDRSLKNKGNKKIHHSHAEEDDEPSKKRIIKDSDEEYILISALTRNITHGSNDWLIYSGASKHMARFKESFVKLS